MCNYDLHYHYNNVEMNVVDLHCILASLAQWKVLNTKLLHLISLK